jgi:hypothetical protein
MPFFPLINEGTSLVQPIYAPDLGKALMHIIHVSLSRFILFYTTLSLPLISFVSYHEWSSNQRVFYLNEVAPFMQKTIIVIFHFFTTHLSISPLTCFFFHNIQRHREFTGKTFQLAGPAEYTYKEVVEFVHDITSKKVPMIDIPIFIAKATGDLADQLIHPFLTADNVSQMQEDAIESSDPNMLGMKTLGIEPVSMDKVAFGYLHRFRPGGHFVKVQGYYGVGQGPSDAKEYLHNPER